MGGIGGWEWTIVWPRQKVDLAQWSRLVVGSRWADERLGTIGQVGGTVNGDVVCVGSGFEYDGGEPQGAPSKKKRQKQDGVNDDMYRETT